jgi:hypothetical protein
MDPRFAPHNLHLENIENFIQNDPQLRISTYSTTNDHRHLPNLEEYIHAHLVGDLK